MYVKANELAQTPGAVTLIFPHPQLQSEASFYLTFPHSKADSVHCGSQHPTLKDPDTVCMLGTGSLKPY